MTLFNPIAQFFEWFLAVFNMMPVAVKRCVYLSLAIVICIAIFGIFYKVKH